MTRQKYVIGILVFWGIILFSFIGVNVYTMQTGVEVVLRSAPLDPRDLFRGDFVILDYDINSINPNTLPGERESWSWDDDIYVLLDLSEKYARIAGISKSRYQDGVFIKGTVEMVSDSLLTVRYGIETYFVRQGKGQEIERHQGHLAVTALVGSNGRAVLKSLELKEGSGE